MKKFFYLMVMVAILTGCKITYEDYEVNALIKKCEKHGGYRKFWAPLFGINDPYVRCHDGTMFRYRGVKNETGD